MARGYLARLTRSDGGAGDGYAAVDDLLCYESYEGWDLILALVEVAAGDREALRVIGAGPLERFLRVQSPVVLHWAAMEASRSRSFAVVLDASTLELPSEMS